jgi:hypothetical protein
MTGGTGGSVNDVSVLSDYNVEMRFPPTVVVYAASSGTSGAIRNFTAGADVTGVSTEVSARSFRVFKSAGIVAGNWYGWNWSADAEIAG